MKINFLNIKRPITNTIIGLGLSMAAHVVYSHHIYTAVNMKMGELLLINEDTDKLVKVDLTALPNWPKVDVLQHSWITNDEKTIYLSTDATASGADSLVIALNAGEINWDSSTVDLQVKKVILMEPASTHSQFPKVNQVNANQPIPAWTTYPLTQTHGPTFLPNSKFTYVNHWTDNRIRAINMETNEVTATMSFSNKSSQTHGINFNDEGTLGIGSGYWFDSNQIDVYKPDNEGTGGSKLGIISATDREERDDESENEGTGGSKLGIISATTRDSKPDNKGTGGLKLVRSIKLGTNKEYAAFAHYTRWVDNRYAVVGTMQLDATSLTPPNAKIIGPSVWLIDTHEGTAKKIIGSTDNADGKGIYRSASDVAIANGKLYVAEEDSLSEQFGRDGFLSIFDFKNKDNPQFIKRLKPGKELPEGFAVGHTLTPTFDGRFVYLSSYHSNHIIKIDTQTDAVVKVWSSSDGLDMPHGEFMSGLNR